MAGETNTSIFDVAKYVIEIFYQGKDVDQITLYKILWFCQGWHYYITDGPLFKEEFEARGLGPVPIVMWDVLKGNRFVSKKIIEKSGNVDNIDDFSKRVIRKIAGIYSQFDAYTLSDLSHQCAPWKRYSKEEFKTIPNDELGRYFISRGNKIGNG